MTVHGAQVITAKVEKWQSIHAWCTSCCCKGCNTAVHGGQGVTERVHVRVTTCHWVMHRVLLQGFVSRVTTCQGLQHIKDYNMSRVRACQGLKCVKG